MSQIQTQTQTQRKKKECPNPLFEQWLIQWREEAKEKNSKMQFVYGKALGSLRKYPLKLSSGRECIFLEFFGNTLCAMIDKKIANERPDLLGNSNDEALSEAIQHSQEKASKAVANKRKKSKKDAEDCENSQDGDGTGKKKRARGGKGYIPQFRSGGYALLVTLLKKEEIPGYRGFMLKSELLREAQSHCDASFTKGERQGSHYTAWNTMATLINKELIISQGNPKRYQLTQEGKELASKLLCVDSPTEANSQEFEDNDSQTSEETDSQTSDIRSELKPGSFEIVLCVDIGETNAKSKKEDVINELRNNGVQMEVMKLNIGDFAWICRDLGSSQSQNGQKRLTMKRSADLIIPFIVERKRSDDLASSIKDGRFHEQKERLSQTGFTIIYLIESLGTGDWGLGEGALSQAVANTQIINEYLIQETKHIKETCAYLTHMTKHFSNVYLNKKIMSCTKAEWPTLKHTMEDTYLMSFWDFNEFSNKRKNWTVTEMFAKQLLKLKLLSVDKAHAIVQSYPTFQSLLMAYDTCSTDKEKEKMLANLRYGNLGKTIGPALSKILCNFYNSTSQTDFDK